MYQNTEKAAPGATNTESGKEQNINLSVSPSGGNVKSAILSGQFEMDEDGSAAIYGAPVGVMIGNMLGRSGYARVKIEVWRDKE